MTGYLGRHRPAAPAVARRHALGHAVVWLLVGGGLTAADSANAVSASSTGDETVELLALGAAHPEATPVARAGYAAHTAGGPALAAAQALRGLHARAEAAAAVRVKDADDPATGSASRQQRSASRSAARPALGPRATLERTPAGISTKATRLAAEAFPGLHRFTWVGPVAGTRQTSGFGQRWGRLHAGLDFAGPVGTRLKSLSSGVVTFADRQGGYGNKVEIMMWDGSLVTYGHMDSIEVTAGQSVGPGHLIGRLGNTGHSTGPHVHLEVRPGGKDAIDPWPWLVARGILPRDVPREEQGY